LLRYLFNLALKWEVPGVLKNPAKHAQLADPQNARERFLSYASGQPILNVEGWVVLQPT